MGKERRCTALRLVLRQRAKAAMAHSVVAVTDVLKGGHLLDEKEVPVEEKGGSH